MPRTRVYSWVLVWFPGLYLKDDMTLKSRGPIPLYYEASMVYESSNLLGFIASSRYITKGLEK